MLHTRMKLQEPASSAISFLLMHNCQEVRQNPWYQAGRNFYRQNFFSPFFKDKNFANKLTVTNFVCDSSSMCANRPVISFTRPRYPFQVLEISMITRDRCETCDPGERNSSWNQSDPKFYMFLISPKIFCLLVNLLLIIKSFLNFTLTLVLLRISPLEKLYCRDN